MFVVVDVVFVVLGVVVVFVVMVVTDCFWLMAMVVLVESTGILVVDGSRGSTVTITASELLNCG